MKTNHFGFLCMTSIMMFLTISCHKKQAADLSFYDFKVAEELETCYELAKHDAVIHDLNIENKGSFSIAQFKVTIPNFKYPDEPDMNIRIDGCANAYMGRVFNIHLVAKSVLARDAIPAMYKSKYGDKKTKKASTKWSFTNGSIVVGEIMHTEKQRRLIKNAEKLNLRYLDSYYEDAEVNVFDGVTIDYNGTNAKSLQKKLSAIYEKEALQRIRDMEEEWAREEAEWEARKKAEEKQKEDARKKGVSSVRF